jgi:S1-C subfamily serine protease
MGDGLTLLAGFVNDQRFIDKSHALSDKTTMIKIQCACGKLFNIPDEFRGRQGKCPQCGTIIVVPKAADEILLFQEPAAKRTYSAQDLFEFVIDTVVGISDGERLYGSGVLVDVNGVVATNRHVVGTAQKVKVRLNNGEEYIGDLLRSYKDVDLAFLRIPIKTKKHAPLDNHSPLKIGQTLYAIGHPLGLQNTITRGIVSALSRDIGGVKYIQTDASINPGNSGGPLFNEHAEMIGINTMILREAQGLGFAIPVELLRERFQLIQQHLHGLFMQEYCGICGRSSTHLRYCEHCGVELDMRQSLRPMNPRFRSTMAPVSLQKMVCQVCQTPTPLAEKYCSFCGTHLEPQKKGTLPHLKG